MSVKRINHWIGGRMVEGTSGRTGPVYNPAQGVQVAEVALASAAEVDAVVEAARTAFRPGGRPGCRGGRRSCSGCATARRQP